MKKLHKPQRSKHQPGSHVKSEAKQPPNSAHYHFENGKHVFTLEVCEGAFTALRVAAHVSGMDPAGVALEAVCSHTVTYLADLEEEEAKTFIQSSLNGNIATPATTQTIAIPLPIKAYSVLAGQSIADGYDNPQHMILHIMADLCAQAQDGCNSKDEKRYFEMFGLKVEANGNTRLP